MILNMKDLKTLPKGAVYVGRTRAGEYPLHFGNPFTVESGGRAKALEDFELWYLGKYPFDDTERSLWVRNNTILLHSKDLACWCAPLPCHAEVLAAYTARTSDKPVFRVIVAGGRTFNNTDMLFKTMDTLLAGKVETYTIVIISGMAKGADLLGATYGHTRGYHVAEFPAFWDKQGKAAGYIRNRAMRAYADAAVIFWDGQSRGTGEMIKGCEEASIDHRVIRY